MTPFDGGVPGWSHQCQASIIAKISTPFSGKAPARNSRFVLHRMRRAELMERISQVGLLEYIDSAEQVALLCTHIVMPAWINTLGRATVHINPPENE